MKKLMFLLTFTVVSITLTFVAQAKTIVTDGLVSYWTFDRDDMIDGVVKDVWGENNATISGNPTIVDGYLNEALEYDGIKDYVNLTSLGDFGSQFGSSTFEAWVKMEPKLKWSVLFKVADNQCMGWGIDFNRGLDRRLAEKPLDEIEKWIPKDLNLISFYFSRQLKFIPNGRVCGANTFGTDDLSPDGKWHHVVYTNRLRKTSRESRLYIDGVYCIHDDDCAERSYPSEGNIYLPFTAPVFLGAASLRGIPIHFFEGTIDEVRIYNRPLIPAEVVRNYKSSIGLSVEPTEKLSTVWGALKTRR